MISKLLEIIRNIKGKNLRGSYSVEAAFIVPLIIGMLFAMLYVLFYLHDKAVLYGNVNREVVLVCEGERGYGSDEEWREAMQEHLWILNVCGGSLDAGKLSVSASAKAQGGWQIPVMENFINKSIFPMKNIKIDLGVKRSNILPSEVLWGKTLLNDNGSD